ncbi:hypothetical protein [Cellulosimicrobium cellulans]|uniref:hypothetical protein n=1 Tax=Cellulosimicrobium cellulans TaxID=1710 RepID=UPI0002FC6219|nr:hypothetical protein [Cellulosimicrobium cellulans]
MNAPNFTELLPIRRRLARARQINAQISELCAEYVASKPARLRTRDAGNGQTDVVLQLTHEQPPVLAYMAGESVHHVRAALDNVVMMMAEHAHGGPLPSKAAKYVQFPIYRLSEPFECAVQGKRNPLVGISSEVVDKIRDVQPFEHYEFASGTKFPSSRHPLARLQALSNQDKHRRVTVVSRAVESASVHFTETLGGPTVSHLFDPPYGDGDALVRLNGRSGIEVRPRIAVQLEIPPFETPEGEWTEAQNVDLPGTLTILVNEVERTILNHILGDDFAAHASRDEPEVLLPSRGAQRILSSS